MKAKKTEKVIRRRRKGTGTILNRRGIFVVRWHDENHKVHQESTGLAATIRNKKAAEDLLEKRTMIKRLLNKDEQLAVLIKQQEDIRLKIARLQKVAAPVLTLANLVEAFVGSPKRKDYADSALAVHKTFLRQFVDWAGGDMEFAEVTEDVALKYAAELGKEYAGSTYNKHINTLTAVWQALGAANGVRLNPWADLPRKRLEAHTRRALTDNEISNLLSVAVGEIRDLIIIGLRTGLRLGDCTRLKWEDFKDDGTVEVKTAKTGAFVKLPAASLIADLGRREDSGYVCPHSASLYASSSRSTLCIHIGKAFAAAGIQTSTPQNGQGRARPDATFHSLRHTFVTRAISAGIPVAIVKELVGHTTEIMTAHYCHIEAETVAQAFAKAGL